MGERGEVTCYLCGTTVGEILGTRFIHHPGCDRPLRRQTRLPRCCRCGGSLYFDPILQADVGPATRPPPTIAAASRKS